MKNAIRFALAGSALLGYAVAHGQAPLPSSGNSDLWLFVTDPTTNQTYARDTGITINSLAPASYTASGVGVSDPVSISLAADSTLSSFLTANSGNTLYWGLQGDNINSGIKVTKNGGVLIAQANGVTPGVTEGINNSSFTTINNGFAADEGYMVGSIAAAGDSFVFSLASGSSTGNAWGTGTGTIAGSINLYGAGANGENSIGQSVPLYLITANNTPAGQVQSYLLSSNIELTSAGLLETESSSPVPLPAAVWLFGSGLLGLAGISRRRTSSAA